MAHDPTPWGYIVKRLRSRLPPGNSDSTSRVARGHRSSAGACMEGSTDMLAIVINGQASARWRSGGSAATASWLPQTRGRRLRLAGCPAACRLPLSGYSSKGANLIAAANAP
jgi:hypothetical protein